MAGRGSFVGRERELSRLQDALADQARLVLVVGDAGIGKTRFVSEGLARAAAGGMSVISGGCLPLAEKLPTFLPDLCSCRSAPEPLCAAIWAGSWSRLDSRVV
jgi:hypothetical protein